MTFFHFFGWIFSTFFFRSEFFWGVISKQKLVLFRFMGFSGRFRHSFTLFGANFGSECNFTSYMGRSTSKEKKWVNKKVKIRNFLQTGVKEYRNRPENFINRKRTNFWIESTPQKNSERKKSSRKNPFEKKNIFQKWHFWKKSRLRRKKWSS